MQALPSDPPMGQSAASRSRAARRSPYAGIARIKSWGSLTEVSLSVPERTPSRASQPNRHSDPATPDWQEGRTSLPGGAVGQRLCSGPTTLVPRGIATFNHIAVCRKGRYARSHGQGPVRVPQVQVGRVGGSV